MPGPPPKVDSRRQRTNSRPVVPIESAGSAPGTSVLKVDTTPDPPQGLLKATREQWVTYWGSDLSLAIDRKSDMPAVVRWVKLCDERERAYRGYRKERVVAGSQGQPVLNPLAVVIQKCDVEIRALEDRLGMNPMSRLRIGLKALGAVDRMKEATEDLEPQWDEEADPQVSTATGTE